MAWWLLCTELPGTSCVGNLIKWCCWELLISWAMLTVPKWSVVFLSSNPCCMYEGLWHHYINNIAELAISCWCTNRHSFFFVKLEHAVTSVKCTRVAHEIGKRKYVNQPVNLGKKWYMELFEEIYIWSYEQVLESVVQCLDAATSVSQQYTNVKQIKIQLTCTIQNNR